MGEITGIEWTDHTFNPWIGCTKVSAACDNCYAEALMDTRWGKVKWGAGQPRVRTNEANWRQPIKWNKKAGEAGVRRRVFCASLADVFDTEAPPLWRIDLFQLIWTTPYLDWLLLTKRPQVAKKFFDSPSIHMPPNVWLGTTVEDQKMADLRIPILLSIPAKVRFLSCEPLLGPVDLSFIQAPRYVPEDHDIDWKFDALSTGDYYEFRSGDYRYSGDGPYREHRIDWIIAGGESGPKARTSHPDWFRALRDQCAMAGVPFFFKQWGQWLTVYDRDKTDPDWRLCSDVERRTPKGQWLNLAGGQGFHGARVVRVERRPKPLVTTLDGREHREFPTW